MENEVPVDYKTKYNNALVMLNKANAKIEEQFQDILAIEKRVATARDENLELSATVKALREYNKALMEKLTVNGVPVEMQKSDMADVYRKLQTIVAFVKLLEKD